MNWTQVADFFISLMQLAERFFAPSNGIGVLVVAGVIVPKIFEIVQFTKRLIHGRKVAPSDKDMDVYYRTKHKQRMQNKRYRRAFRSVQRRGRGS